MDIALDRHLPLLDARIVWSEDGGPFRTVINGRKRHPTGKVGSGSPKSGFRSLPLESVTCEGNVFRIAEASTAVLEIITQPHRLEMYLEGRRKPLIFFPDIFMRIETELAEALSDGVPFEKAALAWRPQRTRQGSVPLLLEVKAKSDKRSQEPDYLAKLSLARLVYRKVGLHFAVVEEGVDFGSRLPEAVGDVIFDDDVEIRPGDFATAVRALGFGNSPRTYEYMTHALGGEHVGPAKLHALHVRRVVSIDISRPLFASTPVRLVERET
jgi:hypothetical protein